MKALLINNHSLEEIEVENTLEALQKQVGGYIETVTLVQEKAVMIVNEEGILLGYCINPVASLIAGRKIVGPALIVGVDGEEFTNIPRGLARRIWLKFG
jgi:hypothetical protein